MVAVDGIVADAAIDLTAEAWEIVFNRAGSFSYWKDLGAYVRHSHRNHTAQSTVLVEITPKHTALYLRFIPDSVIRHPPYTIFDVLGRTSREHFEGDGIFGRCTCQWPKTTQ